MASWPYCTNQWQKLRLAKLGASPICSICELRGEVSEANTVDHIKAINQGGNPFPPLEGLMSLCRRCHSEKTARIDHTGRAKSLTRFKGCDANGNPVDPSAGWNTGKLETVPKSPVRVARSIPFFLRPSGIPVVLVCGPPSAGKSTYVNENATHIDTVIDFDQCLVEAGGTAWHWDCSQHIKRTAFGIRDRQLKGLARKRRGRAFFILSAPDPIEREEWSQALGGAEVVVLATSAQTCLERIRNDPARSAVSEMQADVVRKWWRVYRAGVGEITRVE